MQKYLFADPPYEPQFINRLQSTPMLPLSSRVAALPLEFELSPIIHQDTLERHLSNVTDRNKIQASSNFNTSLDKNDTNGLTCTEEASSSSTFVKAPSSTCIELSTWIGGK